MSIGFHALAGLVICSIGLGCAPGAPPISKLRRARTLIYEPSVPIASRLQPQDDLIRVVKNSFPPLYVLNNRETFEEALDDALEHDVIVLATGLIYPTERSSMEGAGSEAPSWLQSLISSRLAKESSQT
jgi:hypothetical protein